MIMMSMESNGLVSAMQDTSDQRQKYRLRTPQPAPALDLDDDEPESLDSLVSMFWTIEDALGGDDNIVRLPCRLFLEDLPAPLRGPRWSVSDFPEVVVEVDSWDLLCKIKMGRVTYPLVRIQADIPDGWMSGPPDAEIPLDIEKVKAALPVELRDALT